MSETTVASLLSPLFSTKGTWRAVLENFPDSLHVIAVDLPGHGSTTFNATDGFTAKDMAMRMHQLTQSLGKWTPQ